MNALDTLIINNPDLSTLERAAYCAQTADAWRAYSTALEEELDDMGDQRAEAERLGEELADAQQRIKEAEARLKSMEEEHAEALADLQRTINDMEDAAQDAGADVFRTGIAAEAAPPAAPAICSAGLPTVAVNSTCGEIIELRTIDGERVRVARAHYESSARHVLATFTRAGVKKCGRGIHRDNLLTDGAELTPAAQLEAALKAHGWKVARYPRSAEQRAKLHALGFQPIIQTAPGEFAAHPLGLAWAMPARPVFAAMIETARGGQAFPCDPAQGVEDKRARAAVQDSGEATAPAPLVAGRWIPDGAERVAFDVATGGEVWTLPSLRKPGQVSAIAYGGKRTKHDGYYLMRDRARALQWAGEHMAKLTAQAARQAERRAEKAAKRAAGHKLQPGDVLRCSWGYDQTNIDYYEVTRLIGRRMVEIRKIGAQSVDCGNMTGECVPRPGHYIGEPLRKAVSDYDGQSVRIAIYASAHKIEPREVAGVKVWPVDHWTAYA